MAPFGLHHGEQKGVPSDWHVVSVDETLTEGTMDSLRKANPELGQALDQIAATGSPMRLMAVDPDLGTNVNVVVEKAPGGVTRQQYFDMAPVQFKRLGITEFEEERVGMLADEALRVAYEYSLGLDEPVAVVQYVLFENGTGYTLTYTTLASALESRLAEFEHSARSFRVG